MARRYDPRRRERITEAAVRVVAVHGIAGLTHRRVAAEADVPLGSTTYHFASRDDLLAAALGRACEDWLAALGRWEEGVDPEAPFADEVARLAAEDWFSGERARVEYELYLAALRHEGLRPLAAACLDGMTALLRRHTRDEGTARALTALLDGAVLQSLLTGRALDPAALRTQVARVTGEGTAAGGPGSRTARPSG
jgi:DNA-binding transcriptional regulator YbjK